MLEAIPVMVRAYAIVEPTEPAPIIVILFMVMFLPISVFIVLIILTVFYICADKILRPIISSIITYI
jgi:hypothetical protein